MDIAHTGVGPEVTGLDITGLGVAGLATLLWGGLRME